MTHRMVLATIAAAALLIGACADPDGGASRLSTEPGGEGNSAASYVTTGSAAIVDPRTHRSQIVKQQAAPGGGVSASVAAGSGQATAMQLANGSPGLEPGAGYLAAQFVDPSNHKHRVVLLYSSIGGPPVAMQHYIDGALSSTSSFAWQRTATGWVRSHTLLRVVRNGALVGTYTTTTALAPTEPGSGGGPAIPARLERDPGGNGVQRMLNSVAYGLAFALAPRDASAQSFSPAFGACSQEWLKYAAAAAVVVGLEVVIADIPVLTPFLVTQLAAALALLGAAEDALLNCMLTHQPISFHTGFGGGAGGAGGGSGGGGGSGDCLAGSYAAHCTTPFTL